MLLVRTWPKFLLGHPTPSLCDEWLDGGWIIWPMFFRFFDFPRRPRNTCFVMRMCVYLFGIHFGWTDDEEMMTAAEIANSAVLLKTWIYVEKVEMETMFLIRMNFFIRRKVNHRWISVNRCDFGFARHISLLCFFHWGGEPIPHNSTEKWIAL